MLCLNLFEGSLRTYCDPLDIDQVPCLIDTQNLTFLAIGVCTANDTHKVPWHNIPVFDTITWFGVIGGCSKLGRNTAPLTEGRPDYKMSKVLGNS